MTDRPDDYGSDIRRPDVYGPVTVGGGTDYEMELSVSEPFRYTAGFMDELSPDQAREQVPESWELSGWLPSQYGTRPRSQYVFEDTGPVMSPNEINEIVVGNDAIRYVVPAYRTEEYGSATFTPIPNHVVVLVDDQSILDDIDRLAADQGFSPVEHREFEIEGRIRRVYSSLEPELDPPAEGRVRYSGEPGPTLFLIEKLMTEFGDGQLVAEPDWFVSGFNDLATSATSLSSTPRAPQPASGPQASIDMGAARVAILDGVFDLDYTNGRLPFSMTRFNAIRRNDDVGVKVGVKKDHAHGTLCAGLIGAQKPIPLWDQAGVAPGVQMIPVSIYEINEPIEADLGHLVEGIRFAVTNGCNVVSISVAGYLPGSDLMSVVEWAERSRVVLVSGTGNKMIGDPDAPPVNVVLFPAAFESVLGVGAAVVDSDNGELILHRVGGGLFAAGEIADGQVAWESHYGHGLDVVADGLNVTSTDISGTGGASPTDVWNSFSGTSASTPIVAGFAARIASATHLIPAQIRDEIKNSALRLRHYFDPAIVGPRRDDEVGFGFIDRSVIEQWQPSPPGAVAGIVEDETMPETIGAVACSDGRKIDDVVQEMGYPPELKDRFRYSLRPLGDFLIALGSSAEPCATMATEFWRDPYRIARVVGLPWHAAVLLGQGEWEAIYDAIDAENHRNRSNSAGPIWVRVR